MLSLLIVALMDGIPTSPEHLARDFITHLIYTQMFAYDTYYGTLLGAALWTLAVEVQFYLIFPLLARAFLKKPAVTFAAMFAAGWAIARSCWRAWRM